MPKLNKTEISNYRKYHIPGCSAIHRLKVDACFFSAANSISHEMEKARVCISIKKKGHHFITEAERNKEKRRVDVVDISTGIEYEIETDPKRAIRFWKEDVVEIVPVGWSFHSEQWRRLVEK